MKKTYLKPETRKIEVKPHLMGITGSSGSQMVTATPDSSEFAEGEEFASRRHKDVWSDEENEY